VGFFLKLSDVEAHQILCACRPPEQMQCDLNLLSVIKALDEVRFSVAK